MTKKEAIAFFGTEQQDLARAIGVSPGAISQWCDPLKECNADRVIATLYKMGLRLPNRKMITLKQVCNRIPIELVPKEMTNASVLSAISQLKTERNNALVDIEEHNAECRVNCDPEICGYGPKVSKQCPVCPLQYLI